MNKQAKKLTWLFVRYLSLLLMASGNFYIFYKILTPVTVKTLSAVLSLFTNIVVFGNRIGLYGRVVEIAPECVAGTAFFLLFLIVFSSADIKPKTRFLAITTSVVILFILNILRMVILTQLINKPYFDIAHWLGWTLTSTILIMLIWIFIIRIYHIKTIPIYSDLKYVSSLLKPGQRELTVKP